MSEQHETRDPVIQNRMDTYTMTHVRDDDLLAYAASPPEAMAQSRTHLHLARCLICQQRLALFQDLGAEAETATLAATDVPEEYYALARRLLAESAPSQAPPSPPRQSLNEPLEALWQRLGTLLPLRIPAGFGHRLAPQYATPQMAIDGEPLPGLHMLLQPLDAGGQVLTLSSELEQYAGQLYRFVYLAPESPDILLYGFIVLPLAPDDAFCYESRVQIPAAALASWTTDGQLVIEPVAVEALQADDLPALDWSLQQTVETISREAWRVWCQGLQHHPAIPAELRDWCARQLAILTPRD